MQFILTACRSSFTGFSYEASAHNIFSDGLAMKNAQFLSSAHLMYLHVNNGDTGFGLSFSLSAAVEKRKVASANRTTFVNSFSLYSFYLPAFRLFERRYMYSLLESIGTPCIPDSCSLKLHTLRMCLKNKKW